MTHKKRKIAAFLIGLVCILLLTSCGGVGGETESGDISTTDPSQTETEADVETGVETDIETEVETDAETDIETDMETDAETETDEPLPVVGQGSFTPLEPASVTLIHQAGSPLASQSKTVTHYGCKTSSGRSYELEKLMAEMTGAADKSDVYINKDKLGVSGTGALPLVRIDSAAELGIMKSFNSDRDWQALADSYDETFFETKTLFMVSFSASSGSYRYSIDRPITVTGNELCFTVTFHVPAPEVQVTWDMKNWLFLFEIDRADIAHCTEFNATMINDPA